QSPPLSLLTGKFTANFVELLDWAVSLLPEHEQLQMLAYQFPYLYETGNFLKGTGKTIFINREFVPHSNSFQFRCRLQKSPCLKTSGFIVMTSTRFL
ncbi:MAG: hypothetical protein WCD69_29325, partial [Xanthobacteraceae bacterium]